MSACTVVRNRSVTGPGGAIENGPSGADGTVTLTNCTISNNSANSPDSAAIFNVGYAVGAPAPGASIRIESCTFDGNGLLNSYTWTGGAPSEARMTLQNTLLNNSPIKNFSNAGNPYTEVLSEGYNLSNGDGGGLLTGTGDRINADPKLDPAGLLFNGGPTQTIALTQGSAAIDQGKAPPGQITDQRGSPRPVDNPAIAAAAGGDGSDIGAFEASADPVQYGFPSIIVTTAADHNDEV